MRKISRYLIVRADGNMRITNGTRGVKLSSDEIAVPIVVQIPDGWGRIASEQKIDVVMPPPPEIQQGDVVVPEPGVAAS